MAIAIPQPKSPNALAALNWSAGEWRLKHMRQAPKKHSAAVASLPIGSNAHAAQINSGFSIRCQSATPLRPAAPTTSAVAVKPESVRARLPSPPIRPHRPTRTISIIFIILVLLLLIYNNCCYKVISLRRYMHPYSMDICNMMIVGCWVLSVKC